MGAKHLAFDLGASSGRAIVGWIGDDGKLNLEEVHRFTNHPYEDGGRLHWDFSSLCAELETGLQKAFAFAPDLTTFSVDTWGQYPEKGTYDITLEVQLATGERPVVYTGKLAIGA